jgi:penicillin amidase
MVIMQDSIVAAFFGKPTRPAGLGFGFKFRGTGRKLFAEALLSFLLVFPNLLIAQAKTTFKLEGLDQEVEILRDRWGVSHIYAKTLEDLFFAQGFNAARDRLWQLDVWRRQGEGKLAEAFGRRFLDQDKAARLFLYRGDMEEEFRSYHPEGKRILTAFAEGINAYVDLTRSQPDLLPLEFKLTKSTPGYWRPESSLIRIFGLTRNVTREVTLAQLVNLMGAESVERLLVFEPPTRLKVPEFLDLKLIDDRVLASYHLARAGVTFRPEDISDSAIPSSDRPILAQQLSQPSQDADAVHWKSYASNNWVLSGRLTSSRSPILANDPHRAHLIPSLRYMVHLVGPGWNVIGAGEPAIPGVSLGHNEKISNGLTIFSFPDEEDLYVYDTNPVNSSQYLYMGKWEDMKVIEEVFSVRGGDTARALLKFTRHGPVLYEDAENRKAYALRATWLEHEGTAAYLGSLRINQAQNWQGFLDAMSRHYNPSLNMVYADTAGNIGWFGGSLAPKRPNWNGLLPVPGDGKYEWSGYLEPGMLPSVYNPKEGFFATANQFNLPEDYPYAHVSGHEWSDPFRYDRVWEVLRSGRRFTIGDTMQLQLDELSLPARGLVPLLRALSSPSPEVDSALKLLRGWDYVLSRESTAAAIYELWVQRLHENVFNLYLPAGARPIFGTGSRRVLLRLLYSPDGAFGADPLSGRDALLLKSLEEAATALREKLGPDMGRWKWGDLHHAAYESMLSAAADAPTRRLLDTVSVQRGGDGYTVNNTGFRTSDYRQTGGASYRQVIDLGDFDNSVAINTPGQSGNPGSPHYKDLFSLWAEGKYFPLFFSRDRIEGVTEEVLTLQPK